MTVTMPADQTHPNRKQQTQSIMYLDEMPELIARVLLNDRRCRNGTRKLDLMKKDPARAL